MATRAQALVMPRNESHVQLGRPVRGHRRCRSRPHCGGGRRAAPHLSRARRPGNKARQSPARQRRQQGRPRSRSRNELRRVGRSVLRLLQAQRSSDQRELSLCRSRVALSLRQRRQHRRHRRATVPRASRCRAGRSARRASRTRNRPRLRSSLGRSITRATQLGPLKRRPLHALHRRHHRHAQGRDVAPRRHVLRHDEQRSLRQRA